MATIESSGPAWRLVLENEDVQQLKTGGTLASLILNPEPMISKAVSVAISIINTVNEIGGRRGVEICGVIGTSVTSITPKGVGPYNLINNLGASVSNLGPHWVGIVKGNIDKVSDWLNKNNPVDAIGDLLGNKRRQSHMPGGMMADRTVVGPWEKFSLITLADGKIAILAHTGYFAAEGGGGGPVYANRSEIGDWEKWEMIPNPSGSVSFKSINGHLLVAEGGGGSVCNSNRDNVGEWEQFKLEYDLNGAVSIKTFSKGLYLSAQP